MLKIKKVALGVMCSALMNILLISTASLAVLKLGLPSCSLAGTIDLIGACISIFIASILAARWAGVSGWLHGIVVAVLHSALCAVTVFFICNAISLNIFLMRFSAFVLSGALGGMIGVNRAQHIRF